MEQNEKTICALAVETFGPESQINMVIEECAELTNALCKLRRERVGTFDVVTEIADVQIMCEQLAYMFGEQTVADERKRKIERLQKKITKYKGTNGK
jgi:NTP pyrophosphatase (non-canonical NTP hydrolase)